MRFRLHFLLLSVFILASLIEPAPAGYADISSLGNGAGFFGFDFINGAGYNIAEQRYQQGVASGAGWDRFPMYWNEIETTPGLLNDDAYRAVDQVVSGDSAHGFGINAILVGTPTWIATSGSALVPQARVERKQSPMGPLSGGPLTPSSVASPPMNLYAPVFNADGSINQSNYWARFVFATVTRYKAKVKVWEMWNEPDLKWGNGQGAFWTGTDQDYYQLLKVGYQAAKAADPSATILFSGLAYWSDPDFFTRVLRVAKTDPSGPKNGYYFDVMPLHFYVSPYHLYNFPLQYRAQMSSILGVTKPIWVNETNIPLCEDPVLDPNSGCPARWHGTLEQQAAFVIQAYALALAAGVQKVFYFQFCDDANAEWYGAVRNNGTPRPSYYAYKAASQYFSNITSTVRSSQGSIEKVVLYSGPDTKITVIWNNSGTPVNASITVVGSSWTLMDKYGSAKSVFLQNKTLSLTLPAATYRDPVSGAYDLGGDPYIMVERGFPSQRVYLPISVKGG